MLLFRVWDDTCLVETEKFFFDQNNAEFYISTRAYPENWAMDEVETQDEPKSNQGT